METTNKQKGEERLASYFTLKESLKKAIAILRTLIIDVIAHIIVYSIYN
jgi:phosphopantetheinyl transferase (holo-ACP synthase)